MKTQIVLERTKNKLCVHKKKYLDREGVLRYRKMAMAIDEQQDIGARRALKNLIREEYGVNEGEVTRFANEYEIIGKY